MLHLKEIELLKNNMRDEYPFNIPLIKSFDKIEFDTPVTILVGENGTGKSTLLETLACAIGCVTVGNEGVLFDEELEPARNLSKHLRLSWKSKTNRGFFMRAEDFINYTKKIAEMRKELQKDLYNIENEYKDKSGYAKNLAKIPYLRSIYELDEMYKEGLHVKSHGESFLELFRSRFVPGGLYILDEPETPLSPMNQFAFMVMLDEMVRENCQFIIATHSPIIMAFPEASIYDFNSLPIKRVNYLDLEAVKFTKSFLNDPERFIKYMSE